MGTHRKSVLKSSVYDTKSRSSSHLHNHRSLATFLSVHSFLNALELHLLSKTKKISRDRFHSAESKVFHCYVSKVETITDMFDSFNNILLQYTSL